MPRVQRDRPDVRHQIGSRTGLAHHGNMHAEVSAATTKITLHSFLTERVEPLEHPRVAPEAALHPKLRREPDRGRSHVKIRVRRGPRVARRAVERKALRHFARAIRRLVEQPQVVPIMHQLARVPVARPPRHQPRRRRNSAHAHTHFH